MMNNPVVVDTESGPVPVSLRGVWIREAIFTPAGEGDGTTRVVWLQTRRFYADLRIPADRPSRPGAIGFDAFTDDELVSLARAQGFGGVLTAAGDSCLWRRDLDYQPPSPSPDEARFEIEEDRMVEYGLHADYSEIWRRAPASADPLIALRREDGGGLLVIGGDYFLEIQQRDQPLPAADRLAAAVELELARGRRDLARAHLTMRICHGRIAGAAAPWRITDSTLPWLEGAFLFAGEAARFDPDAGVLVRDGRSWRVEDSTVSRRDLAALLGFQINRDPA